MRVREERKSENLKVRDGLGASWRLDSVVQDNGQDGWGERAGGVGDWRG